MRCPYCGNLDDKVLESRTMVNGESIRRRRECLSCGYRFTSYERIDEKPFMVVKRDGRRQPFDRQKLEKEYLKMKRIYTTGKKKIKKKDQGKIKSHNELRMLPSETFTFQVVDMSGKTNE